MPLDGLAVPLLTPAWTENGSYLAVRLDRQIYADNIYSIAAFFFQIIYLGNSEARDGKNDDYWLAFAARATRIEVSVRISTPSIYMTNDSYTYLEGRT